MNRFEAFYSPTGDRGFAQGTPAESPGQQPQPLFERPLKEGPFSKRPMSQRSNERNGKKPIVEALFGKNYARNRYEAGLTSQEIADEIKEKSGGQAKVGYSSVLRWVREDGGRTRDWGHGERSTEAEKRRIKAASAYWYDPERKIDALKRIKSEDAMKKRRESRQEWSLEKKAEYKRKKQEKVRIRMELLFGPEPKAVLSWLYLEKEFGGEKIATLTGKRVTSRTIMEWLELSGIPRRKGGNVSRQNRAK